MFWDHIPFCLWRADYLKLWLDWLRQTGDLSWTVSTSFSGHKEWFRERYVSQRLPCLHGGKTIHFSINKASGGDGIPVELFQILKGDAVKVLNSIFQQNWRTEQWPQNWKRSVFILIPKKGNAKECSNYHTIVLISHTNKLMLKILQARLQQYMNCEWWLQPWN